MNRVRKPVVLELLKSSFLLLPLIGLLALAEITPAPPGVRHRLPDDPLVDLEPQREFGSRFRTVSQHAATTSQLYSHGDPTPEEQLLLEDGESRPGQSD